jgi:ring-1,2-phenylacetyl-CoA epoxidase subunit PaaE
LDELVPLADVDHFWLCGPFGMVETARATLRDRGVDAKRVHRELFYVEDTAPPPAEHAETAPSGPTAQVTIVLDGRATTLILPRDVPILDAAQRVRTDLPFACKGGVCGTCRARVTSGEVRMRRNFALEDDELAQGFVLTCQALPTTDEVTVDYDA